jgi:hypothetical protein
VVRGVAPPFDPRTVAHEFAQLAREYGCTKIIGDAYAGEWVAGAFTDAGMRYETAPLFKSQIYLETLPYFNRGAVSIPANDRLLRELRGLERRVQRSGKDSVDHPRHGSDDLANSVCGALYIAMHALRRPRARTGFYGYGGKVYYPDEDAGECRLRYITIDGKTGEKVNESLSVTRRDPKWLARR